MADGLTSDGWRRLVSQRDSPLFASVREILGQLGGADWPRLERLNELSLQRDLRNQADKPIRFVAPAGAASAMAYELQIATSGEIPTRENLHDLLNAMQWLSFPQLKRAINTEHVKGLQDEPGVEAKSRPKVRSKARDVLTMFDESGVIVASADASLLELLRSFQWRALFVERRLDVVKNMRFHLVGHGLMEKALTPFIGITGKAILLPVTSGALDDVSVLDGLAADWLTHPTNLASAQHPAPLPLLGVPGWDARNQVPAFYDNVDYFRPGRLSKPA